MAGMAGMAGGRGPIGIFATFKTGGVTFILAKSIIDTKLHMDFALDLANPNISHRKLSQNEDHSPCFECFDLP